jgi:oligosaccharyltransferase complex subunit beta
MDGFHHVYETSPAVAFVEQKSLVESGPILSPLSGRENYRGSVVYPSGAAHVTGENAFLIDILRGGRTGYIGKDDALDADEAEVEATVGKANKQAVSAGKELSLVSAMQTRDNVRIGFVGSGEMFSDKWWDTEAPAGKTVR